MALASGTKLGPYEIQSPLGAGGMGEVYRAKDTRLDRTVAVKILPAHLSDNPEARQRFEREARTISSINHPNICTLHDVGSQDGVTYLVMEHVDGEPLDVRLQKGPLPLKQSLECAMQICDALEKAHRAGIIHRDLKPSNIILTAAGAKLLDFGLAKPVLGFAAPATDKANLTPSTPTMNISMLTAAPAALTQQGTVVGTFQYMAPEILQGRDATARSDIFSFGCVLYEMITGRRAFEGKSQLSVMTAILEKDPEPLAQLQPATPPALDYVVQTCLEKNPDSRFQTAHDVKLQLNWVARQGSQTNIPAPVIEKTKSRLLSAALAFLALGVLAASAALWFNRPPRRILRTNLLPPEGMQFETLYRNGPPALSPDGTRVAFIAQQNGSHLIWIRALDQLQATPVKGTEDAFFPFWSPDGNSLAYFQHGKLWRMDVKSGSATPVCDALEPRGGSWGRNDTIVLAPFIGGPVMVVAVTGGAPKPVTHLAVNAVNTSDRWPVFLPDGKHFLFLHTLNGDANENNEIRFASVDGGEERSLMLGRFYSFAYAPGWLLAVRDGALQAWKFDPSSGKLGSEAIQLADHVATDEVTALAVVSVSAQGTLLYQEGHGGGGDRHVWVDETGKQIAQVSDPSIYGPSRLSPDGSRIATEVVGTGFSSAPLWIWDLKGGTRAPLTPDSTFADTPVWSADGKFIYLDIFDSKNHRQTMVVPTDGSQPEKTLIQSQDETTPVDVTADGKWLLYEQGSYTSTGAALKALPLVPGLEGFTVLDQVSPGTNARLKPASNDWLAYESNHSGRSEIYLARYPHPGAKYQVSPSGGNQPVWSRDGKKLYYLDTLRKMTAVEVATTGDSVQIGAPKTLFQTGVRHSIATEGYDVSRDGRFLLVNSIIESTAPLVLVTNWDAELKK
jgi:serine/threonine protein kinase